MRLYRGLTRKYRPERVGERTAGPGQGTDFTDRPYRALQYATGTNGTVLVVDVPPESMEFRGTKRVRAFEALYSLDGTGPRRFLLRGAFDDLLVAEIPAKTLRAQVRRKGVRALSDEDKSRILEDFIERWINGQDRVPQDLDRTVRRG